MQEISSAPRDGTVLVTTAPPIARNGLILDTLWYVHFKWADGKWVGVRPGDGSLYDLPFDPKHWREADHAR